MSTEADRELVLCQQLLQGYSYVELPDLSADRLAVNVIHIATLQLEIPHFDAPAAIVYAARVLAAYCGAQDVLLAVELTADAPTRFVRVTWNEGQSWEQVITDVARAVQSNESVTLSTLRRVLDISEKQFPCIAMCDFTNGSSSDYPIVVRIDTSASSAEVLASKTQLHPSVSTQILRQFDALARDAITNPFRPMTAIESLPVELMSVYERVSEDVLRATYPHLPLMRLATDYLAQRAKTHPHATAVRWYPDLSLDDGDSPFESMSYAVFDCKANQFARWLLRRGLQAEDRVAVCMKRDLHFHTAMIGIMRAGGCYVPIDPELPVERKSYIASDAGARFVLTSLEVSPPELFGSHTIYLDDRVNQEAILQEASCDPEIASPDGLAFLLYTSGTTGNPKGCLLTHRGLAQAIFALSSTAADARMDDITQGRYLAVASIAFDVHLAETIVPMALGMPLLSAPRSQLLECLPLYVKMFGITHLGIVPSLIEATLNAAQEDGESGDSMVLRYIASGGEKMSDSILDKWANHPQVRLANFYGPSEATIGCCARYMSSSTPRANIGRPLANVSGYVVDSDMNILLRGGIGELVVEGPLVGRGYHGRPDLTKKVFLEWPGKGCWAYCTGDLVRMMPDSTIEILGRIDTQIKLRGVRIESEGISAIVRKAVPVSASFALDATTVLAKHPSIGSEQLVSFFTWDNSISIATRKSSKPTVLSPPKGLLNDIRKICDAELASYMRPSHLIPLSWLPLSSNGKTDAKTLVEIFTGLLIDTLSGLMAPDDEENKHSRPASQLEKDIFEVLRRHTSLPLDQPHPDLNLFECGLDSMGVIRFASDLKATLGQRISALDIMKEPTLSGVASILDTTSFTPHAEVSEISSVNYFASEWKKEVELVYRSEDIQGLLPPFTVQEGVLARSADDDTLYVQHVLLAIRDGISLPAIQKAWDEAVRRHPILRTVFHLGRTLVQVVLKSEVCMLQWTEKKTELNDSVEFSQWFLISEAAIISKDINNAISQTSPLRVCAYTSPSTTFLVVSIHHALYDGISLPLLVHDVERVYSRLEPMPCAILPRILEQIANADLPKARSFWMSYFEDFSWPIASIVRGDPAKSSQAIMPFKISLSSLKAAAASQQVTLQALLTCAFARLLATLIYHSEDVAFGIIRSGRLLPVDNVEVAMCPMISLVPFRVNFCDATSSLEMVQRGISAMVEHEQIPLSKVQNWIRPGEPLFETLFSVSVKVPSGSGIWDVVEHEPPEADYPLSLEIVLNPEDDSLTAQAAWIGGEITHEIIDVFMHDLEVVALNLGAGNALDALGSKSKASASSFSVHLGHDPANTADDSSAVLVDLDTLNELRAIVAEFLGVNEDVLGDTASLISMGLDSIKSVGLTRVLRKKGYTVTSVELMKNSTLRKLSSYISSSSVPEGQAQEAEHNRLFTDRLDGLKSGLRANGLKLTPEDVVEVFPTTALQAGMLSQTVASDGGLYVHAFPVELSIGVDFERLNAAWKEVVNTFSILRTSFHFLPESGEWAQAVHSVDASSWSIDTFRSTEEYGRKLTAFVAAARLPEEISFSRPPVWVRLFHPDSLTSKVTSHFVLVMHHALYDGISIGKLLEAMGSAYKGTSIKSPTQFTQLLSHFIYQEMHGTSFWLRRLRNYQPFPLRRRSVDGPVTSHLATCHIALDSVQLSKTLTEGGITPQCLGQAAWAKTMAELSGSSDVVFGHVVSGRSVPCAEDVIGPVLNTIPCRICLQKDDRNIELLCRIQQANVDVMSWQQSSLRSIQKEMRVEGLWDSIFVFQPQEHPEEDEDTLWKLDTVADHEAKIQYPINLELYQTAVGFTVKCACRSDYFMAEELADIMQRFQHLLENIINHTFTSVLDDLRDVSILPSVASQVLDVGSATSQSLMAIPPALLTLLEAVTKVSANLIRSDTSLAALGIDSITAIQVVSKCRRAGMRLSASDVVASRTIGDVAAKIKQIGRNAAGTDRKRKNIELSAEETTGLLSRFGDAANSIERITISSSGMKWLLGAWQRSERSRFHGTFCYRLPSNIDPGRLNEAWTALVKRHAILRSTFACADIHQEPRVVIFNSDFATETWEQEHVQDDVFFNSVLARMKDLLSRPFPTVKPPTMAVLIRSSRDQCLIFHLHHFQYDAWSLQLLVHDLSLLYQGSEPVSSNDMSPFLELFSPNSEHMAVQEQYWKSTFPSQFTPVYFPTLLDAGSDQIPAQQRTIVTVEAAITKAALCEERARSLQVSLQAVFLTCWARIQCTYSSSQSSTFGLWQAGRTGAVDDIAKLAVPCMNVLPLHISDSRDGDVIAISRRVQDDLRSRSSVVEQSDLVKVHEWLGAEGSPLYNVFVNIVRVAPDVGGQEALLKPVNVPYFVPDPPAPEENPTIGRLAVTEIVKDDLLIDIVTIQSTDSILMSIDAAAHMIDAPKGEELIRRWAQTVQDALGVC